MLTIDTSPAGSWRRALDPEGPACKGCGQNECDHTDAEYQGLIPPYLPDNGLDCGNGATLFHPAIITPSE